MKILILILIMIGTDISAQDMSKNHQKYWYLRSKLRNDLMKVGLNQGESIPMTFRGKNATAANPDKTLTGGGDLISEIGIYLGVLATEYQLLSRNNQNTDSVRRELYCALNAVNRLDYNAEPLYGYSNSLNGFLIRDDIPGNFVLQNYKHFNYYNQWSGNTTTDVVQKVDHKGTQRPVPNTFANDRGFQSVIPVGQWETSSVYYENYQKKGTADNMAMSQDHLISLMYGLRLIIEYVDASANYQNQTFLYGDGAYSSIKDEAQVISDRIVKYLKNNNWRIKEPNGDDVSDHNGGNVLAYAYPFAQIAGKINQPGTSVDHWNSLQYLVPTVDQAYHDAHSTQLGFWEFQTASKGAGITFDLITQIAQLSSGCQCLFDKVGGNTVQIITLIVEKIWKWLGTVFGWIQNIGVSIVNTVTPISWTNSTLLGSVANATALAPGASQENKRIKYRQDYALLTNFLYQEQYVSGLNQPLLNIYNSVLSRTSDILNSAPCDGPRNFSDPANSIPSYDIYEWSSSSLIEHTNTLGSDNLDFQGGEYNGLDYMLYHNLYYLYKQVIEGQNAVSIDLRDRFVNYTLPLPTGQGSQSSPLTIGAMENINAYGTVNSNAAIQFRMGKQFSVIQGHEYAINNGAEVSIEPYNYNCSSNSYLSANALRQSTAPSDDVYGPIAALEKLHDTPYVAEKKITNENTRVASHVRDYQNKSITNLNENILLYPLPNQGNFTIRIEDAKNEEKYNIAIYDMTGKLLSMHENLSIIDHELHINENLINGAYIAEVLESKTGKKFTQKLIINKK